MEQVIPKELTNLNLFRKITRYLPYHCSYCGRFYKRCHNEKINLLMPIPQNGWCCPDGHEGFIDEFIGCGEIRYKFDFVKYPVNAE